MRSKLKLSLDQLTVDSFSTSNARKERGTVFGEQCTYASDCHCLTEFTCTDPSCEGRTCGEYTCQVTCVEHTCAVGQNTCANTCPDTCEVSCVVCG